MRHEKGEGGFVEVKDIPFGLIAKEIISEKSAA